MEGGDAWGRTLSSLRLRYGAPFAVGYEPGGWGGRHATSRPESRFESLDGAPYLSAEDERRITELLSRDQAELDRTVLPRLRRLAAAGDSEALVALGDRYVQGRGVTQDRAEAIRYYRRAAEKGCGFGLRRLRELKAPLSSDGE